MVTWVIAGVVVIILALAAQTAFAAFWVSKDAAQLESEVAVAQTALSEGRFDDAATSVDSIAVTAAGLRDRTADATWWRAQRLPIIGESFAAVHVLSATTADIASAAQPVVGRLKGITGSAAGLASLTGSSPDLQHLQQVLQTAQEQVAALPDAGLLLGTDRVVQRAKEGIPALADGAAQAARLVDLLPGIVGSSEPTRWLVMLQNPAESRGAGGLFSALAVVEFTDGKPKIVEAASRKDALDTRTIPYAQVVDPATSSLWGTDLGDWASFNLSSDFPTVARLAAAGMAQRGTPVQGVVAIDPTAVSALLAGTGPVEHKGVTIDKDTAAAFFTRDIYTKFPDFPDVAAKDELVMGLLYATADSLLQRPLAIRDLWTAAQSAVDAGHIKAWSADQDVESWFAETPVGGQISSSGGPDVVINLNNITGGKVDTYVHGTADYVVGQCVTGGGVDGTDVQSTVTLALTNEAPTGLPPYVDLRLDNPSRPRGSTELSVHVYGPKDATISLVTLDGDPVQATLGSEAGRPVWGVPIELARGTTHTLAFILHEPAAADAQPTLHAAPTAGGIATSAKAARSTQPCPSLT